MKFTSRSLPKLSHCPQYEDVIFLPRMSTYEELNRLGKKLSKRAWIKKLLRPTTQFHTKMPGVVIAERLFGEYNLSRSLNQDTEPDWIERLSPTGKRHVRGRYALAGDGLEHFACQPSIPYSGLGYVIVEGGLTDELTRALGLHRLSGIRQLGYLHDPIIRETSETPAFGMDFDHTRYSHVLDVMAVTMLILLQNRCPDDFIRSVRAAALSHDALTPAGGDTTKLVDPVAFDEDAHYPEALAGDAWRKVQRQFGLDRELMIDAVQGRGLGAEVLDIADKLSYVARDAAAYQSRYSSEELTPGCFEVSSFLQNHSLVCGLWDAVVIRNGRMAITEPDRLGQFLHLRGLLYRNIYQNPAARYFEHIVSNIVVKYLYGTGQVTRRMLLAMQDAELDHMIDQVLGRKYWSRIINGLEEPRVECFSSEEKARQREEQLRRDGVAITYIEHLRQGMKPCTNLPILNRGKIVPFEDAFSGKAEQITELFRRPTPYRLYYALRHEALGPEFFTALAFARQAKERR